MGVSGGLKQSDATTFLASGLMGARVMFIHFTKAHLIVTRMLGHTQRWAIRSYSKRVKVAQDNV